MPISADIEKVLSAAIKVTYWSLGMWLLAANTVHAAEVKRPIIPVCVLADGSVEIERQRFTALAELKAKAEELGRREPKPQIDTDCE